MPAFFQNEQFGFALLVAGAVLASVGGLWLIVRAFRTSFGWGLAVVFLPIIGPLVFIFSQSSRAKAPLALILFGAVLGFLPLVLNVTFGQKKAEIPLERETGGMKEFNALNANDPQYDTLLKTLDFTNVNVSRADLTDEIAERLSGQSQMKVLDMNDSSITDKTLAIIATLPNLETLNVARVKGITEDAFKTTILKMVSLKKIDARGTAITVATLREWRNAAPDRKTNPN